MASKNTLNSLNFDNSFVRELPADKELKNFRRQVAGASYSRIQPTTVSNPKLLAYSEDMANKLGISSSDCLSSLFTEIFSGNKILEGMDPFAMCYGGHQFGNWAGQLGDGRAINLGETINKNGERFTLQLKGSGATPYSRTADGLAVLRSSLREFLCSEAMFHLGVPTTRALSLISSGEPVERDMFYSGEPKVEPGAIVCRVSPSFIRFGNFEILAAQNNYELLKSLVDYTIKTSFPELGEPSPKTYLAWFKKVTTLTADMILHWMRVGFVHGVMNTDNMSTLGLTIDYGPYGWLEDYDPKWTPNTTDAKGKRYSFGNQPYIGQWNLTQLANAIYPLVENAEPLQEILSFYNDYFQDGFLKMMSSKLGLASVIETDKDLTSDLRHILQIVETDMTIFYRKLAQFKPDDFKGDTSFLKDAYYNLHELNDDYHEKLVNWLNRYANRLQNNPFNELERKEKMNLVNPKYVLRNYLAQVAIDKAESGDNSETETLLTIMHHPYDEQPEYEKYAQKRPEWARNKAGCSMLSCSS
ncbi:MAG: YdiU family protein [Desulfotalea sp.]